MQAAGQGAHESGSLVIVLVCLCVLVCVVCAIKTNKLSDCFAQVWLCAALVAPRRARRHRRHIAHAVCDGAGSTSIAGTCLVAMLLSLRFVQIL